MVGYGSRAFCCSMIMIMIFTPAMLRAEIPAAGQYLTDLGMAEIRHEGEKYRIVFEEVIDFEIRGSGDDDVSIFTGDERIPCAYLTLEFGSFAFAAAGDTLYFIPQGEAEPYLPHDGDPFTTYGGGGAEVKLPGDGKDKSGAPTDEERAGAEPATGTVLTDDYMGLAFSAPEGWKGRAEPEGSFTLIPSDGKGTILVSTHVMNSIEELRNSLRVGVNAAQAGTALTLDGDVKPFGEKGVASKLRGTFKGEAVSAYNVSLLSPYGGGATIMAWAAPGAYSADLENAGRSVAAAVTFRKPMAHPDVARWMGRLPGSRLSYVESDFTPGLSTGGYSTGSSYNIERHIDLCSDGSFHFTESTDYSVDAGSAGNAGGADSDDHTGRWRVYRFSGLTVLEMRYSSGGVGALILDGSGEQILLDGEEWSIGGSPACR